MNNIKKMVCVENMDLENVLTIGKIYDVKIEKGGLEVDETIIHECSVICDDGIETGMLIDRFKEV